MNIYSYKDITINEIILKKPYQLINNITFFDIIYINKSPLIIKTPKLIIPFKPTIYETGINISFLLNNNYDDDLNIFKDLINNIENHIFNKLENKYDNIKSLKKKYSISDQNYKDQNIKLLKTKVCVDSNNKPSIEIFKLNKEKVDFNNLPINSPLYAYIRINKVWVIDNKIGLTINIVQLYLSEEIIQEIKEEKRSIPEEYLPFFKMLEVGVPKIAIKLKMELIGLDPSVLDKGKDSNFIEKPILKPNLNDLLLNKNNLRKVVQKNSDNNNENIKKFKPPHNGPAPPSLENILETLNKLKKS